MELTEQQRMDLVNAGWTPPSNDVDHASGVWNEDPLYELAVNLMREVPEYACISRIQRKLMIGYNRASRLMDAMIARDVIARTSSAESGVRYTVLPFDNTEAKGPRSGPA
jgi:DNA segregation ATPase FtsK/SpoIIIE-like protein